jgi:hypothetical protein
MRKLVIGSIEFIVREIGIGLNFSYYKHSIDHGVPNIAQGTYIIFSNSSGNIVYMNESLYETLTIFRALEDSARNIVDNYPKILLG